MSFGMCVFCLLICCLFLYVKRYFESILGVQNFIYRLKNHSHTHARLVWFQNEQLYVTIALWCKKKQPFAKEKETQQSANNTMAQNIQSHTIYQWNERVRRYNIHPYIFVYVCRGRRNICLDVGQTHSHSGGSINICHCIATVLHCHIHCCDSREFSKII